MIPLSIAIAILSGIAGGIIGSFIGRTLLALCKIAAPRTPQEIRDADDEQIRFLVDWRER